MVNSMQFRDGMSRLAAAVNVITTDGPAGRRGFTASAVCSVTDDPPTLLLCVNRNAASHAVLRENGVLCINVLAQRHTELSALFASRERTAEERFAETVAWTTLATGAPVLRDATVAMDCRIAQVQEVGTHSVFFCEVQAMHLADRREGLIYFDRGYHPVGSAAA